MKIKVNQKVEVEIDEREQRRIFLDFLFQKFDWHEGYYIDQDLICQNVECYGSHSFSSRNIIRQASETDILINKLLSQL